MAKTDRVTFFNPEIEKLAWTACTLKTLGLFGDV